MGSDVEEFKGVVTESVPLDDMPPRLSGLTMPTVVINAGHRKIRQRYTRDTAIVSDHFQDFGPGLTVLVFAVRLRRSSSGPSLFSSVREISLEPAAVGFQVVRVMDTVGRWLSLVFGGALYPSTLDVGAIGWARPRPLALPLGSS